MVASGVDSPGLVDSWFESLPDSVIKLSLWHVGDEEALGSDETSSQTPEEHHHLQAVMLGPDLTKLKLLLSMKPSGKTKQNIVNIKNK